MHKYAQQQDAEERGIDLDIQRAAVASTVSNPGHKLYLNYRKLLDAESRGEEPKADPATTRKRVRSKLVASGAIPVEKK